jgi:protein O-GlcNAc transferase
MNRMKSRKKQRLTKKNITPGKTSIDINNEFTKAIQYHKSGQLYKAEEIYKRILEVNPNHSETLNLLGVIASQSGNNDIAVKLINKAIQYNPGNPIYYYHLGIILKDQGKLIEAKNSFQKSLEIKPDYVESHNNIGVVFIELGELSKALTCFQKALEIKPEYAEAHFNLGTVFKRQDKQAEAISSFQKALEINPNYTEAYNNLGAMFKEQGDFGEAILCFQKVLEINPEYVDAYNNMGAVFIDMDELTKAFTCFQKALRIKPEHPEAHYNLGIVFNSQNKRAEAIFCFQKALEIKPEYAEAYHNLGNVFIDLGRLTEALSSYQKALEIEPDHAKAFSELFYQFQQLCDWNKLEDMTARLDDFTTKALDKGTKTAETPFLNLSRHIDPSRNFAVAKSWSCDIARAMSNLNVHFPFEGRRSRKNKIVVGYLSNAFRNHAMAYLTLSLYGLHNRDEFNIFCYSYGEDDGSYYSARIQQDCDKFVDIGSLNNADAARCIYDDQVDILVDLRGYTKDCRLEISALRPAPIQVRYLGLEGTTGADFFDYIITDKIVTPEDHAQYYSENFAYLPHCHQINDYAQTISNKCWNRADFGLPEDRFVFCSFSQGYKIEPVMFNTWINILQQVPETVLWLQRKDEITEKNLRQEAESKGIESTRLIFSEKLSKEQHMQRLSLADVALDTRIVNGAATTSDALWSGVPVITLQGNHFSSRASASMLTALGLPELITSTLKEYESLAVDMARNPGKLKMIRQKLMKNLLTEPLFNTTRFTRNLEKAYKEMWKIFATGEMPRQIAMVEEKR